MESGDQFPGGMKARILGYIKSAKYSIQDPESFEGELLSRVAIACENVRRKANPLPIHPAISSEALKQMGESENIIVMVRTYGELYKAREKLIDERRAAWWADFHDRMQILGFRLLLALMVAGTVLLTGALAKHWEIPLPGVSL